MSSIIDNFILMVDLIYDRFNEQKLLFFGSEGTQYSDYLHSLVTTVQEQTLAFMDELRANGVSVNEIDKKEMHLLLSAQYSTLLEMVKHDFTYEEALHYADTVSEFFNYGWRNFLGF